MHNSPADTQEQVTRVDDFTSDDAEVKPRGRFLIF